MKIIAITNSYSSRKMPILLPVKSPAVKVRRRIPSIFRRPFYWLLPCCWQSLRSVRESWSSIHGVKQSKNSRFACPGSLFQMLDRTSATPTISAAIALIGLPLCLFFFYAAITKAQAETEEDDKEFLKDQGRGVRNNPNDFFN